MKLLLASSNPGKLREYRELARGSEIELDLIENFQQASSFRRIGSHICRKLRGESAILQPSCA